MQEKVKTISFQGQNIYIGIDAHLKNWTVTAITDNSFARTVSQNPEAGTLFTYLQRIFPGGNYYSAYEAGFCGFSIHRELQGYGIKNIVVNTGTTKNIISSLSDNVAVKTVKKRKRR